MVFLQLALPHATCACPCSVPVPLLPAVMSLCIPCPAGVLHAVASLPSKAASGSPPALVLDNNSHAPVLNTGQVRSVVKLGGPVGYMTQKSLLFSILWQKHLWSAGIVLQEMALEALALAPRPVLLHWSWS